MWYTVQGFKCPRSIEHPQDYEDAFAANNQGFAAISDGVASAIFSDIWSQLLVESAVEKRPDFSDKVSFREWLSTQRDLWRQQINMDSLGYFQKMKLQRVGGAFATFMTLAFRFEGQGDECIGIYDCQVYGDCCLFHERKGELLSKFPMIDSEGFKGAPDSLGSTDQGTDDQLEFYLVNGTFEVGDRFFMTTDAVGEWIYNELEGGTPIDWEAFASMNHNTWKGFVVGSRNRTEGSRMTVDDSTMMVISVVSKPSLDFEDSPSEAVLIGSREINEVEPVSVNQPSDDENPVKEFENEPLRHLETRVAIPDTSEVSGEKVATVKGDFNECEADSESNESRNDLIVDTTNDIGEKEATSAADLKIEDVN